MGNRLIAAAALLGLAACQPMYGAPPTPIRNPPRITPKGGALADADTEPKKVYVEDCEVHTRPVTKAPKRDIPHAEEHLKAADTASSSFDRATAPKDKAALLIDSIQEYGNALERDPYNAEATLKLALAYDKAQRKGCALAMLDRLAKLADHPTYERSATERIDDVENHKTWFGDYRKDAIKALKR